MRAGDLDKRITLLSPVRTTDANTGEIGTQYLIVANVFAQVRTLTSRESLASRQTQTETTHKILIRYRNDVRTDWQIRMNDPRTPSDASADFESGGLNGYPARTFEIIGIEEPPFSDRFTALSIDVAEYTNA